MAYAPPRVSRSAAQVRRRRLALAVAGVVLAIVVIVAVTSGGGRPRLPLPGVGRPPKSGDPFAYVSSRQTEFEARAVAGKALQTLKDAEVVVVASGSCGAMLKNFYPELFAAVRIRPSRKVRSARLSRPASTSKIREWW